MGPDSTRQQAHPLQVGPHLRTSFPLCRQPGKYCTLFPPDPVSPRRASRVLLSLLVFLPASSSGSRGHPDSQEERRKRHYLLKRRKGNPHSKAVKKTDGRFGAIRSSFVRLQTRSTSNRVKSFFKATLAESRNTRRHLIYAI